MPYSIYPEGFYKALNDISKLNIPIIVTENGIADNKDDRRETFINRYLYALNKSINEGLDIQGYFYWSLMDNFEWAEGYSMKFGLYEVDFTTQKRKLRNGSLAFKKAINRAGVDERGYIVSIGDTAPDLSLELIDNTSPYALTGCVFSENRDIVNEVRSKLRFSAGNFYVNDKPTGAVVGQQPFGGSRASGTNDKGGSMLNLLRWTSPRTIKETFEPPQNYKYPYMDEE